MNVLHTNFADQYANLKSGNPTDYRGEDSWCYAFGDWFCEDNELKGKAFDLFGKVERLLDAMSISTRDCSILLMNRCPVGRPLYDQVYIYTEDTTYVLVPKNGARGDEAYLDFYDAIQDGERLYSADNFEELLEDVKNKNFSFEKKRARANG